MSVGTDEPAAPVSVQDRFTLRQAVAWIAWRDPEHPLLPEVPKDLGPASLGGWLEARAALERLAERAAEELAAKINDGKVAARGKATTGGWPGSDAGLTAKPRSPIQAEEEEKTSIVIPVDWLEAKDGGWLLLKNETVNGWDSGPRFCRVTVDAAQVRATWPLGASVESAIPETRIAEELVKSDQQVAGNTKTRRGGKDYEAQDWPLIKEMHRLLTAPLPTANSVWEATDAVVARAAGGGTLDAKRKRLLRRYSEALRAERFGKD
jgi:hypothetical protein